MAYMPFVGMFLRNIVEPIKSQDAKVGTVSAGKTGTTYDTTFTKTTLGGGPFKRHSVGMLFYHLPGALMTRLF